MTDERTRLEDTTVRESTAHLREKAGRRRDEAPQCPYLLVMTGRLKHKKILLLAGRTLIGRDPSCHLVLDDPCVSARHLRLVRRPEGVYGEDLDSANGTLVNGQPPEATQPLRHGDRLQIGRTELEFRYPTATIIPNGTD